MPGGTAAIREQERTSLYAAPYALSTIGSSSLVFLAAFESLAVTTVMPVITAHLDGRSLYSLAFAATLAAGVVGMVVSGAWADRRGPSRPLLTAIAVFTLGLLLAASASSMAVFIAARFLQGLGAGGITVALYLLVARVYPAVLHPRIFGLFAAAWVVPSMVGPFVAGLVADLLNWRWVFLPVVALVAVATAMILPVLRRTAWTPQESTPEKGAPVRWGRRVRRIGAAVVVAAGAVLVSLGGEVAGWRGWLGAAAAATTVAAALRGLLPPGTYRARRGLPATVLLCGLAGATFFSTEVYLPLLLHDRYGLPGWLSGITLTAGALAWALGSHLQGRFGDRSGHRTVIRIGAVLLAAGAVAELLTAALLLHPAVAAVGWALAGGGMGVMYPRISTLVLATSSLSAQGFNTAAKSIADTVGGSVALATSGLIFDSLAPIGARASFAGTLTFSTALGVLAVLVAPRVGPAADDAPTMLSEDGSRL